MKASEFDRAFDEGEDVAELVDVSDLRRPGTVHRRVNIDFPAWMIDSLDREAKRLGVSRQAIIKLWLAERLRQQSA